MKITKYHYSTISNSRTLCMLIRYCACIVFGEKINPVRLFGPVHLLNLGFLGFFPNFLDFSPKIFSSFHSNLIHFPHFCTIWLIMNIIAEITMCIYYIPFIYQNLGFFHPVHLLQPVWLLESVAYLEAQYMVHYLLTASTTLWIFELQRVTSKNCRHLFM